MPFKVAISCGEQRRHPDRSSALGAPALPPDRSPARAVPPPLSPAHQAGQDLLPRATAAAPAVQQRPRGQLRHRHASSRHHPMHERSRLRTLPRNRPQRGCHRIRYIVILHVQEKRLLTYHLPRCVRTWEARNSFPNLSHRPAPAATAQGSPPVQDREYETDENLSIPRGGRAPGVLALGITDLRAPEPAWRPKSSTAVPTDLNKVISFSSVRPAWRPAVRSTRSAR